ncbi:DUF1667 domain-containing protein [Halanaerobium hydrogeniformans]|uniref:Molybdopterin oxidoreductase, 4Fe-4S cluster-binding subunit n=1 Tax=Halanaerobium hydrogeniformans TaxID=656519 RepID=E4RIH8_HALHG|nr:DUF1667 domain-containing protein [Halanaerobium hydrogeniformans]ADQ15048.1 protein of unknown function DUF1667 [Halanaerobium hydrogeniformans]
MIEKKQLTCVACPKGCEVAVEFEGNEIISIDGHACPQGEDYAKEEVVAPTRILPTTAVVKNGSLPLVPVKTTKAIPLEVIHDAMSIIGSLEVEAPIKMGDVLIENILDTGADIVATRNLARNL